MRVDAASVADVTQVRVEDAELVFHGVGSSRDDAHVHTDAVLRMLAEAVDPGHGASRGATVAEFTGHGGPIRDGRGEDVLNAAGMTHDLVLGAGPGGRGLARGRELDGKVALYRLADGTAMDRLVAGDGEDELKGWGGGDHLIGERGRDELKGAGSDDRLEGRNGRDMLKVGRGGPRGTGGGSPGREDPAGVGGRAASRPTRRETRRPIAASVGFEARHRAVAAGIGRSHGGQGHGTSPDRARLGGRGT